MNFKGAESGSFDHRENLDESVEVSVESICEIEGAEEPIEENERSPMHFELIKYNE